MQFIADFWWIWMIGAIVFGGIGLYNWVMGFFKTAGTVMKAANLSVEAANVAADKEKTVAEKANQVKDRAAEELIKEGKSRLFGMVGGLASLAAAWVFAILLILSIVLNVITFANGS